MKNFLLMTAMAACLAMAPFAAFAQTVPNAPISANGVPIDTTAPDHICAVGSSSIGDCKNTTGLAYASGGCTTTPVIVGSPDAFRLTNGASGCAGSTMVLTLPAARTGWVCDFHDITNPTTTYDEQSADTTTSVTVTNYTRTTGVVLTWVASDVLKGKCSPF